MTTQPVFPSPSSSSFAHDSWTYDVFLSFRGADTRTTFTDHLRNALVGKGIHTFIDDDELQRGEEIKPALVKTIEDSRISVIVFSENYAYSRWCLDELVEILRCKQSKQQIVFPIFYKVDPSDVRHQRSKFGEAFDGLIKNKFKDDKEKVIQNKWRKALTEAANLSGRHFEEGAYEATFINSIVDGILSQVLSRTYLNVAKYPVGIQSHVQDVEMLLDVGGNGRHMVGIWGTSGIGKTTIVKAIFNAVAYKFEGSCFLPNVREGSLIQLQKALLQEILGGKKLKIVSADKGISIIHERLRHKRILLILDDVNQLEQLDNLAGVGWFGEGSRVIITTQDSGLLKCHGIELIYEVQKLCDYQALELFSWHAFRRSEPPEDYLELAQRAIAFADGLPLAITLLGSHLRNKGIHRWQAILDGFKGEPYADIGRILQKSYDALDDYTKEAFLDIACFFKGEFKDYVLQIVPKNCIEVLVDKAMITIEGNYRILMHDLLANLGKDIVHKESPNNPGQRSRLWFYEDVERVLTENKAGTSNIKGIMVKLPKPAEITLNPECFRNMVNLKIFINRNASLCGPINYLPNALRFIDWPSCQLQSLPSEFHPEYLVVFNMPGGSIRRLEKLKNMPMLTYMNLRGCQFLEKIPDLSGIPNIKYLDLCRCTSLVEVDDSVGRLDKLVELNLKGCVRLTRFATRLRLKSLKTLYLSDCKRLESFPEIEVEMESLWMLDISGSGLRELPSSIAYLTGLYHLDAQGSELQLCPNLSKFCLKGCSQIRKLERFKHLPKLRRLDLSGCQFLEKIPDLSEIPNIEHLYLSGCTSLVEIDNSIGLLDKLVTLALLGCIKLTRFATRHRLNSLKKLSLAGCKSLESIPELENMPKLVSLNLDGCVNLTRFATRLRLNSLKYLSLRDCKRLESFPEIEVEMESLRTLDISGSGIREFPSSSNFELPLLPKQYSFTLRGCNLTKSDFVLPLVFWYTLTELDLLGNNFVNLPRGFSKFVNLRELCLIGCKSLLEIPEQVLPPEVNRVWLDNCTSLEKIPEVSWVLLDNCTSLEKIPELPPDDGPSEDDPPEGVSMYLSLTNCVRLRGYYDITENIFLNPRFDYDINLPGDEVPKWFSCRKDATIVKEEEEEYEAGCEVSFEIPPNLKWETLRLVLCVVAKVSIRSIYFTISLNGERVNLMEDSYEIEEGHVRLMCIPLLHRFYLSEPLKPGNMCKVEFLLSSVYDRVPATVKIPCGVHLLGHQVADVSVTEDFYQRLLPEANDDQHQDYKSTSLLDDDGDDDDDGDGDDGDDDVDDVDDDDDDQHQDNELPSLPSASETSLGKRPRESDFMALDDDHCANALDIGDHEAQWLTLFTGPADHPKRRHIDLNEEPKQ